MKIEDYLIGHWTNKHQAQSNPSSYVTVEIVWKIHEEGFQSINYKRCDGPSDPYRKKNHKILYLSDTKVIIENYHLDWTRHDICDMMFTFDGTAWQGKLAGDQCRGYRGDKVVSNITAYGDKLHTCDQGYDLETGELVWGSLQPYKFTRKPE
ncbi:chromophore lyase [Synechococcus phage S-CAM8]|jgi:hypothetical protein|uniref:Chromophore lyase n=1 Tax=Synechococcus phage S-CAM8 TaxID=754038 RepID=G8EXW5_9CAUD|nr:CpeT-like antenna protein [Synechococcus phage S-CAM8]AET72655.1 hypothetical protein SXFG_00105 [Synechococcus phage S-CAM8]AGN33858.1 hypothetical protein SXCG_00066 [Synechococcus phage S-CAM8]AOV59949.1 chromophore lyase [Synechococcus phage S-CAM8]